MKPLTLEWLEKAEGDLRTAAREQHALEYPNFDAATFHAQQAAKKLMKAVLCERDVRFPRTHDLLMLLDLFHPADERLLAMHLDLEVLSQFAVQSRYPRYRSTADDAARALDIAKTVATICRSLL